MKIKQVLEPRMKWGVAGCGYFAESNVIPALKSLKRSRITSVFSNSINRAKEFAQKFTIRDYYDDFQKFLEGDFDAVYIASANKDHYQQVLSSAKAKKHIICEKPLALTSEQAKEMVEVCKTNNVKLSVGYVQRFHPLSIKAKEIVESGMLGRIVIINVSQSMNYPPNDNYRFKKELSGGGALRDIGTHCIDLLRYFGGEVESIRGYGGNVIYQSEVDDFFLGSVKFKNSGYGNFYSSYCISKPINRIEIVGYKGTLIIEGLIGRKLDYAKLSILLEGQVRKTFWKRGNKLLFLIRNFQNSILKGSKLNVTGEDGYVNLLLMEELERNCK